MRTETKVAALRQTSIVWAALHCGFLAPVPRTRRTLLLLAALAFFLPSAAADTYPRQPGVDAVHYIFRLALTDESDEIQGEADISLRFVADGIREAVIDLATPADGKGMTVLGVESNGAAVRHTHEADRLRLTLAPVPAKGELRTFKVRYRGTPASGLVIGANKYKERTFFSVNWPNLARQWTPMIDHPYDKATSEFIITAPTKYQVVANGLLQEEIDLGDGTRRTHWKNSVPIASWLNAIGVAQFAAHHAGNVVGVPLQTWVFHQDRDAGVTAFEGPARQAMELFSNRVGPYAYEKLANVEAAGLGGGTEHASVIFYGERSISGRPIVGLVAHEIAHQWFGNAITESDWDDVWLSEGFATYFASLFTEHYQGRDAFVAGLRRARETVFNLEEKEPKLAVIHDNLSDMTKVLNRLVYQKGGWTLHMLRGIVGTETFWAGIRDYYQRYRNGNVSTDDFRRVIEEHSGKDLAWFFDQWLKRPGSPAIEGNWSFDSAAKKIKVELAQTQNGAAYRLPLEIAVETEGARDRRVEKIEMTAKQQSFEVAAESEPTSVVLDPDTWILMHSQFAKK
ncbi:MAG TPA: M1 family metallopeptidase [Sinorhizobium sp.]|nr:M1 family metallopeptidase [Sinorhizobium sp.]